MIITQTPLRVSFLGGNTDLPAYYSKYGGMVLTTTIDKYIHCIVKKRFDDLIKVKYSIQESVERVEDLKHDLVREALKLLGITKGIEICFLGDIPSAGTGLGSSSSVVIGVLNALHAYKGETVSTEQLAKEAIKIEVDILKKPIGIQDQYIIALGGLRWMKFSKEGEVESKRLDIPATVREDLDNSLMLFYTGLTRSSSSILSSLNTNKHIGLLHKNVILAKEGVEVLEKGQSDKLGKLLDTYWKAKKQLSTKISNTDIDEMYEQAIKAGAIGGKILGAGGGGFMLLMVPDNKRKAVRSRLNVYEELPFRLEHDGSKVILNVRRY